MGHVDNPGHLRSPVLDSSELKTIMVASPEAGVADYKLQAEPARKLVNLQGIPIVMVTSEGSFASPGNPGAVAFFKQAGCVAEELRLADSRNSRERALDDGREK